MQAIYSILHADTYQHCDLQASASKNLIPEHIQLLKRVHDSTHHASFYRVAGATTVYCKCCQRNRSTHVAGSESSGHVSQRKVPMWHGHGTCSASTLINAAVFAKRCCYAASCRIPCSGRPPMQRIFATAKNIQALCNHEWD